MTGRLAGRVALVTGASRGLGKATAQLLAAEGCSVAFVDLKTHWAEAAAETVTAAGGTAIGLGADVSDRAAVQGAIDAVANKFGRLDVLVNNAMWNQYEPIESIQAATMDRMLGVGFAGIVWGIQCAVPVMKAGGGGSIINIASVAALLGISDGLLYCGIKTAVVGLTRAAATELGKDGIRVNAVAPSTIETEGVRDLVPSDRFDKRITQTPAGRLGTPEDIARAVRYFACDDSSFVTGQMITVDGGMSTSLL